MKKLITTNLCIDEEEEICRSYQEIPQIVQQLVKAWESKEATEQPGPIPMPSHESVVQLIHKIRCILFPGYFSSSILNRCNLEYVIGQETTELYASLSKQIILAMQHECFRTKMPCIKCQYIGHQSALAFIKELPRIEALLATDIKAALEGDPAAKGPDEVIFSYPGLLAISIYRMANILHRLHVPTLPRIMTEHAHSLTGIDIHPGATIGESFFIDHGTGVVVGETTTIGNRVRLYQGVTLGALSLPHDAGERFRNQQRHPTIEDDVIIYANTTILGGETTIGARSIIGGNIWLTESVPPDTKVLLKRPELTFIGRKQNRDGNYTS
jgi:serine O-acetyltransferase